MTSRRRPIGRPAQHDDTTRQKFLDAVAAGMYLQAAAEQTGIHRNLPRYWARHDHTFAAALDDARARGKQARDDAKDHDEYRYNVLGCRCDDCRAAHATARAGRRATEHEGPEEPEADVVDLHPTTPPPESVVLAPLLAKAS